MLHIHSQVRAKPASRGKITCSTEPSSTVIRRYGVNAGTVRKRGKHDTTNCLDHSTHPYQPRSSATDEEHAIVYAVPRQISFPLNGLTFVICSLLPYLDCGSIGRVQKEAGLHR